MGMRTRMILTASIFGDVMSWTMVIMEEKIGGGEDEPRCDRLLECLRTYSVLFRWQTYNVAHSTILHCSVE